MAIDFGNVLGETSIAAQSVPETSAGIILDLKKNPVLDLTKRNPGLEKILVGAGWDVATNGRDFDLDLTAFLLHSGRITSGEDVIYFGHKKGNGIFLNKDNRTGAGEGDDEMIEVELSKLDSSVTEVVFCIVIYEAKEKGQTFGHVKNARVHLVNQESKQEMGMFQLNTDYSTDTAIIFSKLVRNGSEWDYKAIGEGKQADLNDLAAYFS